VAFRWSGKVLADEDVEVIGESRGSNLRACSGSDTRKHH
jgi:hypothetical protein